ncbi:MAG: S8 family serine peptidase, partial [Planctomycetota bacterium]
IPGNGLDDDGNGWPDDVNGWDFYRNDNDPGPAVSTDNHGTAVAGVAGAIGDNSLGVTGAAPHVQILPIKVFEGSSFASSENVASAIYYAAGRTRDGNGTWRGADILNNSWGGGAPDPEITAAFDWANTNGRGGLGVASFAATGNSANNDKVDGYVPVNSGNINGFAGTWSWVLTYQTDASGTAGDDTVRLAQFMNADSVITRFDTTTPPTGWNLSPFVGTDGWFIEDNPARAYGTSRYQARSAMIGASDVAYIMAPPIVVTGTTIPGVTAWLARSSESEDVIGFKLFNFATSQLYAIGSLAGFNPPRISGVSFPANLTSTIAVGASTDWDYRANYSQFGNEVDIVAPSDGGFSSIATTDRTGSDGYNTASGSAGDYTTTFGGTSSATPLAAGIGALLLSKNPGLTSEQIRQALRNTTDKIGNVTYSNGFNQYYGYGRVNAQAALAAVIADTTGPTVSNILLTTDTGVLSTDRITTDTTPILTLTFSERAVWTAADITVRAPDGSPVIPTSLRGTGTNQLNLVLPTITATGTYTVTLDGTMSFRDQAGNRLNGGSNHVTTFVLASPTPPMVTLNLTGSPLAEAAGTGMVTATLSSLSDQPITIDLGFSGTATNATDYTRSAVQIVIPAGNTTGTVTLTAVQDTLDETNETIVVDITGVTNGAESGTQQVTATITDDDGAPTVTLSVSPAAIAEAAGTATVTATLSNASGQDVTVDLGFSGTATNATDYTRSA